MPCLSEIRACTASDLPEMMAIINASATAYKGVIPTDRWHEPYMSWEQLNWEITDGVCFWGFDDENVLIGAFVNATVVLRRLLGQQQVHLLCAGTDGEFSEDDILLAGLIVERLQKLGGVVYALNAQAITAREYWLHRFALPHAIGAEPIEPEHLEFELRKCRGAKQLIELGYDDDILAAARVDQFKGVPE